MKPHSAVTPPSTTRPCRDRRSPPAARLRCGSRSRGALLFAVMALCSRSSLLVPDGNDYALVTRNKHAWLRGATYRASWSSSAGRISPTDWTASSSKSRRAPRREHGHERVLRRPLHARGGRDRAAARGRGRARVRVRQLLEAGRRDDTDLLMVAKASPQSSRTCRGGNAWARCGPCRTWPSTSCCGILRDAVRLSPAPKTKRICPGWNRLGLQRDGRLGQPPRGPLALRTRAGLRSDPARVDRGFIRCSWTSRRQMARGVKVLLSYSPLIEPYHAVTRRARRAFTSC